SELLKADCTQGFDLGQSLLRITLIRLKNDLFQMIWSTHHLCIDGWSWPILFRDVATLYEAFSDDRTAKLPAAPPYRRYVAWLRETPEDSTEFWRKYLCGITAPTALDLASIEAGKNESHVASEITGCLTRSHTARLRLLGRTHHMTLSTLVQAAWAVLLAHYNDANDTVFGAAFSGRPAELAEVEDMVGPCVTNVPVRVTIDPNQPIL